MSKQSAVIVKNQLSELERMSRVVEAFGEDNGVPPKAIFQLNLALDEILTNVMSYGYTDTAEHEIVVRLSADGGQVIVEVEDDGREFNPLDAAAPDLDAPAAERSIGGLGIHLARKVIDQLEYRREQGKNLLVMRKSFVTDQL
jgi:anti-sigma regulatory factor (Ser/Thr protein kinase)